MEIANAGIPRFCMICGKEILPGEYFEQVSTKRGTEVYTHTKCCGRAEKKKEYEKG